MQGQKEICAILGSLSLFACVGVQEGPEAGVQAGIFSSGIHGSYQLDRQLGIEAAYSRWHKGIFDPDDEDRTLSLMGRYFFGTVFVVKAGLFASDLVAFENNRYGSNTKTILRAKTLGPKIGIGNIWHLKKSISIGCEYISFYKPMYVWDRTLTAEGARVSNFLREKTDDNLTDPYADGANFYIGYRF